jgi:hypothetical protein
VLIRFFLMLRAAGVPVTLTEFLALLEALSRGTVAFAGSGAQGSVPTGESSHATFGGSDRKTLYVTSRSVLKYVTLAVPGLPD